MSVVVVHKPITILAIIHLNPYGIWPFEKRTATCMEFWPHLGLDIVSLPYSARL